ncbi:MAG: DNA alkylation repair protein [Saprospiraceae bacterium]|nr:DNA alkylation repair protein [Saprospiraceae bacterium]MBK9631259.1 DNA alkylation repair protein [Saprospiraceae bacterium]
MSKIFRSLKILLEEHEDPRRAAGMSAYMRNQFVYLGIPSPLRKELGKQVYQEYKSFNWDQLSGLMLDCWSKDQREYKYAAFDYAAHFIKFLKPEHIPFFENFIGDQSWWDTVDFIAPNLIGKTLQRYPDLVVEYAQKWNQKALFWYPRAALIMQLFYRDQTNFELMQNLILSQKESKEFFIRKAAGWALRQYSKTNPTAVQDFIQSNHLHPLTVREGLKWINSRS